ncbi:hypothetical protein [Vibrio alginolyticus]|uniref:hypothetical protein n=1 Tax=Vibrio alginolyticus TaxID=663 RepID=UPI000A8D288D|nr:hypothetical protein [Vibrio alginolyticus]
MKYFIVIFFMLFLNPFSHSLGFEISDCGDLAGYSENQMDLAKKTMKCVNEKSNSPTPDSSRDNLNFYGEAVATSVEPIIEVSAKIAFSTMFILGLIGFVINNSKSKFGMNADKALKVGCGVLLMSFFLFQHKTETITDVFNVEIRDKIISMLTFINITNNKSQLNNDEIMNFNIVQINETAKKVSYSIVSSEICALSYEQDQMSFYKFEENLEWSNSDINTCLTKQKGIAKSKGFTAVGGRSPLNYAVKYCSNTIAGEDYDCGNVLNVQSSTGLNSVIQDFSKQYVDLVNSYDGILCNQEKNADFDDEKAKNLCKTFEADEFKLKSFDGSFGNANNSLITLTASFTEAIKEQVSKEVKDNIKLDVGIFSIFEQVNAIFGKSYDIQEVFEYTNNLLSRVQTNQPYVKNFTFGHYTGQDQETVSRDIESVSDYFQYITNEVSYQYTTDEINSVVSNEFMRVVKNPELFFGSYTKNGFEIDSLPLQKIKDNSLEMFMFGLGTRMTGEKMKSSLNPTMKLAGGKIVQYASRLQTLVIAVNVFPLIFIAYVVGNIYIQAFLALTKFFFQAAFIFLGKQDASKLIDAIVDFKLVGKHILHLSIALTISSFLCGLLYDVFYNVGLIYSDFGTNAVSFVYILMFLVLYIFTAYAIFIFTWFSVGRVLDKGLKIVGSESNENAGFDRALNKTNDTIRKGLKV